jgi:hypothetical protein
LLVEILRDIDRDRGPCMATPEKRENSVLFSLRELRTIEENRVQEEEDASRSAEEARLRAKMDEERRKREEADAIAKAEADELRRIREEELRRNHEATVRVGEASARAQAEHQAKLDQERLQHEMDIRRQEVSKKRPTWLLVVAGVLAVAIGISIYLIIQRNAENKRKQQENSELAAQNAEKDKIIKASQDQIATLNASMEELQGQLDDLDKQLDDALDAIKNAKTDTDRQAATARVDTVRKKKQQVKTQQEETKTKINLSQECLNNPLGCR